MRLSLAALSLVLLRADAFTSPTFVTVNNNNRPTASSPSAFCLEPVVRQRAITTSTTTSLNLKREDILRRMEEEGDIFDLTKEYVQSMSPDQRRENLEVIRQIFKSDLADLQRRKDYSGWVEARKDLKKREADDPWFELNNKLREAVQMDETEQADKIKALIEKVGGPPPGVKFRGEYAKLTEIMDTPMSIARAEAIAAEDQRKKNHERWKQLVKEREANEKALEEEERNNPRKEEEEALIRRERMLKRLYGEQEEKRKKAEEKAREIMGQYKGDEKDMTPLDRALAQVKKDAEESKRQRKLNAGMDDYDLSNVNVDDDDDDDDDDEEDAVAAKKTKSDPSNGRPRLPGDIDVTRGELMVEIADNSDVTTDDLRVRVSSDYSASQSDPPMRKHCFQYTIKITNQSETDTVQLLSRRFEIQTVGAKQKDVVQGQGVTGRRPILKPGETFEYTSTAPLSVRPIGTTDIAARMKGTYSYSVVDPNVEEDDRERKEAELGTFHFVFPPDQRVKPVTYDDKYDDEDDDDEDDDDDDDDDEPVATSTARAPSTASSESAASSSSSSSSTLNPPTTLPGDDDMRSGSISPGSFKDNSETVTESVRVTVTSEYREERSDNKLQKHCFAYSIRITNERPESVQLVSRRFEIQTIGSAKKDVIQGPGVTGRQPVLKPGESFEYTSTAPLSVKPLPSTPVVARMSGEYSFVVLGDDGKSPLSSEALKARLGVFHFVLPQVA